MNISALRFNSRIIKTSTLAFMFGSALLACSCTRERDVQRVDPGTVVDVDYRFNDTDARQVWEQMSQDAKFRPWIDQWLADHGGKRPVIIIGSIKNDTQELISTKLFTRSFEREMLNSGRVRVVAARDDRGELRDERLQGAEWNSPETRKILKNELGADLMLLGDIQQVKDKSLSGNEIVNFYQVNLDLINIESNEKAWIGTAEIKKVVKYRYR